MASKAARDTRANPTVSARASDSPDAGADAPVVLDLVPDRPATPEPTPEPTYPLELRLDNPALTGDSAYHVRWPESRIRALLAGDMIWVPVPVRAHLPGQAAPIAARFVYIQAIAEIIIHGWPQEG